MSKSEVNSDYDMNKETRLETLSRELADTKLRLEKEISRRRKIEKNLGHRISLEKMLFEIAALSLWTEDVETYLDRCIDTLGNALDVSRTYIFKHHHNDGTMDNTHEWVAENISPEKENLQQIPETITPWWVSQLKQNRIINFNNIEDIPSEPEKEILRPQNIKSILVVPLFVADNYYGFMGFDECRYFRKWMKEDVEILETAASLMTKTIAIKKTEQMLRVSEQKFRSVVERCTEGIMVGRGNTILYANQRMAGIMGITLEKLYQHRLIDGIHPEDKAYVISRYNMGEDGTGKFRVRGVKPDGSNEVIDLELHGEFIEYNEHPAALIMARDVTTENQIFSALQESEAKYRMLADNLSEGIILIKVVPFQVLYVNQRFEDITGYTSKEFSNQSIEDFARVIHPEDLKYVRNVYKNFRNDNPAPVNYEHRLVHKDGSFSWINAYATMMVYEGEPTYLIVASDITDKKRLETQLQQSQKMEAIGTLASGIAHDFNNILAGIIGYTELSKMEIPDGTPGKENLELVLQSGYKAKDLIKRILTFSRRTEMELNAIDIALVIKDSIKLLRATLPSFIEIEMNIEQDTFMVKADQIQIHRLMINICTNAAQAMEENGGKLSLHLSKTEIFDLGIPIQPDLPPGPYVYLKIADSGIGMTPEVLGRIFEPYFTTKEMDKGTGLGLAAVHGIVKSHNGGVTVESEPGRGTAFHIYFPEIKETVTADISENPVESHAGKGRILFIDDDNDLMFIGQSLLSRFGYEVTGYTNPLDALNHFQSDPNYFDLVITDMTMPKMTGDTLSQKLFEIRRDTPVILCTGYSEKLSKDNKKLVGIREVLTKPLDVEKLLRTVKNVMP